jgi:hypothetical protein
MENSKKKTMQIIGRREFVDFPELGLKGVEAKIDTGAFTTALHCHNINVEDINGKKVLSFYLLDPTHPEYHKRKLVFHDFYQKNIKNSFGDYEARYIIKTVIKLGKRKINSTLSLANRQNMRYPVLIGRKLIGKKFLVDVSKIHLLKKNSIK